MKVKIGFLVAFEMHWHKRAVEGRQRQMSEQRSGFTKHRPRIKGNRELSQKRNRQTNWNQEKAVQVWMAAFSLFNLSNRYQHEQVKPFPPCLVNVGEGNNVF